MNAIRKTLRIIGFTIGSLFLLLIGTCTVEVLLSGPKHTDHGPVSLGRIPTEATNVDYVIPAPFAPANYASFDISEAGYLAWVADWTTVQPKLPSPERGETGGHIFNPTTGKVEYRTFKNVLHSYYLIEDRALSLIYDLDAKRAYFHSTSR